MAHRCSLLFRLLATATKRSYLEGAFLLTPHSRHRIDFRSSERRKARQQHNYREHCYAAGKYSRIMWADLKQHAPHETHEYECGQEPRTAAQHCPLESLTQEQSQDLCSRRAQCHSHADLMFALLNRVRQNPVDSNWSHCSYGCGFTVLQADLT